MRRLLVMMSMAAATIPAMAAAQPGCVPASAGGTAATTIPCSGYYDADGVWRQGGGHYDADGAWHGDSGHYDADGGWVATPAVSVSATTATAGLESATDFGVDTAYTSGAATDVNGREQWLENLIRRGQAGGALRTVDAGHDLGRLESIRGVEARYSARHNGLTDQDRTDLASRLDDLGASVSAQWRPRN